MANLIITAASEGAFDPDLVSRVYTTGVATNSKDVSIKAALMDGMNVPILLEHLRFDNHDVYVSGHIVDIVQERFAYWIQLINAGRTK